MNWLSKGLKKFASKILLGASVLDASTGKSAKVLKKGKMKDEKGEKDKKSMPKERKKKKMSTCAPATKDNMDTPEKRKRTTSKGAPAEKDEKDSPKKAKKDTKTVMSTKKQSCNTLDHYFIRAERPAANEPAASEDSETGSAVSWFLPRTPSPRR